MTDFLKIDRDGHVVTLTLNRPEKRNAISNAAECAEVADDGVMPQTLEHLEILP